MTVAMAGKRISGMAPSRAAPSTVAELTQQDWQALCGMKYYDFEV